MEIVALLPSSGETLAREFARQLSSLEEGELAFDAVHVSKYAVKDDGSFCVRLRVLLPEGDQRAENVRFLLSVLEDCIRFQAHYEAQARLSQTLSVAAHRAAERRDVLLWERRGLR